VVGVDGSAELLEISRQRAPGVTFVEADLADGLPSVIESDRFDRVISNMVIMDIPRSDRARSVASQMRETARHCGRDAAPPGVLEPIPGRGPRHG
jgi:ubiquinone/menaquinone biosynthesis C-methylase UbiE